MKKLLLLLSSLIITSILLAACASPQATPALVETAVSIVNATPNQVGPDEAVASVNGEKITARDFLLLAKVQRVQAINRYMQYTQYAQMLGVTDPLNDQNFGPLLKADATLLNDPDVMGKEVINSLINENLIRQVTKNRGIVVSKEEVDKKLQESFGYYANGTPTPPATATTAPVPTLNPTELAAPTAAPTLEATAAPTSTPVTLAAYNSMLKERVDGLNKETGLDEAGYRHLVETSLLSDKLVNDLAKDMKTSEEQVWARHILVATLEEANAALNRIRAGEDFASVAANVSTDTSNREKGGDLGWFGKGVMVPAFEEAAFALKVGQISEPVKSDFGYHIIELLDRQVRPLTEQQIQQAKDSILNDFLKNLRSASDVQIFTNWKGIVPTEPSLPTQ